MHPHTTQYRLANSADEPELLTWPDGMLPRRFPTIVAERDGEIIGYLGTHDRNDCIMAGPMEVRLENERAKGAIALRLIEAYEIVLLHAGVEFYFYGVQNGPWRDATERSPRTELIHEQEGIGVFKRYLPPIIPADRVVH